MRQDIDTGGGATVDRKRVKFMLDVVAFVLSIIAILVSVLAALVERRDFSVVIRDAFITYDPRNYSATFLLMNGGTQDVVFYAADFKATRTPGDQGCPIEDITAQIHAPEVTGHAIVPAGEIVEFGIDLAFAPALRGEFQICIEAFVADPVAGTSFVRFPAGVFRATEIEGEWVLDVDNLDVDAIEILSRQLVFRSIWDTF